MARGIDFLTIRVTLFFIIIAWCVYILDNILLAILIGLFAFILMNMIADKIIKHQRPYSYNRLALYLTMSNKTMEIIASLLPENSEYVIDKKTIATSTNELIYVDFGLKSLSPSSIITAIKEAEIKNAELLTIVTTTADRSVYNFVNQANIPVNIINIKQVMKMLVLNNTLPVLEKKKKSIALSNILNRAMAGRFLLAGSIIALMSLIVPIKIYYLVMSCVCLLLGIIAFIPPLKPSNTKSLLKK